MQETVFLSRKILTNILIHITYDVNVVLATKDKNNDLKYWNSSWDSISIIERIISIKSQTVFLHLSVNIHLFCHFNAYQCFKRCHNSNDNNLVGTQTLDLSVAQSVSQIVNLPTRFQSNSDGHASLLDLHLTPISELLSRFATLLLVTLTTQ